MSERSERISVTGCRAAAHWYTARRHTGTSRHGHGAPVSVATIQRSDRLGRNYQRLFAASTISNLGDGVALIAYPWLASAITRNPVLIALVVVVQRLPWLLFALPAGVLTDRHDRRRRWSRRTPAALP